MLVGTMVSIVLGIWVWFRLSSLHLALLEAGLFGAMAGFIVARFAIGLDDFGVQASPWLRGVLLEDVVARLLSTLSVVVALWPRK